MHLPALYHVWFRASGWQGVQIVEWRVNQRTVERVKKKPMSYRVYTFDGNKREVYTIVN